MQLNPVAAACLPFDTDGGQSVWPYCDLYLPTYLRSLSLSTICHPFTPLSPRAKPKELRLLLHHITTHHMQINSTVIPMHHLASCSLTPCTQRMHVHHSTWTSSIPNFPRNFHLYLQAFVSLPSSSSSSYPLCL